ncbi:MAG: GNAT family N-acetyltransferase [Clostridia bacterium]|nr:GNAT family N-acetyltransferase [Clostridia bacterium]
MIIRFLSREDVTEHNKITSQAFSYSCDIEDPDSALPCEKVLGAFDDDNKTLFADFELIEKKCNYDGGILTCAAIGGVAAKPEHRGKGAVTELFRHLFNETEYDISILYPFSEEYYRRLGYERAGFTVGAGIPFTELSGIKRNNAAVLYEGKNKDWLLEIYNKCARNYNLCFVRESGEFFSDKPYFSQKYTYVIENGAYATIEIDRAKSTVFVNEIYYDSTESMMKMLGFLRNFESNQKQLYFHKLPADTPLTGIIREMKNCEIRMHSAGAVRILNTEKILQAHKYPLRQGSFTLKAGDDIFGVTVSSGSAAAEKNPALKPDVIMDTCTASKILLCGFTPGEYLPGLTINNPQSDFFRMFPPKTSFFSDPV